MRSNRVNCSLAAEHSLVYENILLQNERITQLYVIQAEQNPFLWFGVLFIDHGIYSGAVIRFNMYIEDTYPDCPCPKIVLHPIPSHPLINPITGELDTKHAFPDWNSNSNKLFELLLFVKRVIRQADDYITLTRDLVVDSIPNENHKNNDKDASVSEQAQISENNQSTASDVKSQRSQKEEVAVIADNIKSNGGIGSRLSPSMSVDSFPVDLRNMFAYFHHTLDFIKMYELDHDKFLKQVEEFKTKCFEQLLDRPALCGDDRNALVFTPWISEIHNPIRDCVLAGRFTPTSLFASYHKDTDSVSFIPGHEPSDDQ